MTDKEAYKSIYGDLVNFIPMYNMRCCDGMIDGLFAQTPLFKKMWQIHSNVTNRFSNGNTGY